MCRGMACALKTRAGMRVCTQEQVASRGASCCACPAPCHRCCPCCPARTATPHRYLEQPDSGLVLTAGSLAVEHIGSDTHMHIDPATAQAGAGLGLG